MRSSIPVSAGVVMMMKKTKRMRMRMMCVVVMMGQVHGRVPGEDAEGGLHTDLQVDRWKHERGRHKEKKAASAKGHHIHQ